MTLIRKDVDLVRLVVENALKKSFSDPNNPLRKDIKELRTDVNELKRDVNELKRDVNELKVEFKKVGDKVNHLDSIHQDGHHQLVS